MLKSLIPSRYWLAPLFALCAAGALQAQSDITQPGDPIVATSSNSPGSEGVANAIDNKTTKYLNFDGAHNAQATGFTVTPSVGATIVTGITLQSANDAPERDPATYKLEGSNDGTNFTTISFGAVPAFTDRFQTVRVDFTNNFAFKAYKLTFPTTASDNGCCMQVAEVELLGTVVPPDVTQPGDPIVATSSNSPGSEGVANAIDNKTTKYLNFDGAHNAQATGFTVTPSVGATVVTGLTLQSANDAPERDPATYKLEGSNDGTNFVTISAGAVPAFTDRFQTVQVFFSNNKRYTSYRLTFPTTASDNGCCMQVAEVELLGNVAPQDVTQPGDPIVATSSNSPGSEGVANAIDNKTTKYLNFDGAHNAHATGFTVTPSVGKTIVTGLTLQSANDAPERDPATYKLEGSTDGTNFVTISAGAVPAFTDRFQTVEVDFDNSTAYTSYRLTFPTTASDNGCCMQVAEVELLGFATGSSALPQFKTQPTDTPTLAGASARFYVVVNGPWQIQWYKNNQPIPGANKLFYVTDAITAANDGDTYYATAKNGALVSQSDPAHVRLFTPSTTKSIGINFIGGGANGAPTSLTNTDIAGVQAQAYWNNTFKDDSNGDFPQSDADGNPIPFTDSSNNDAAPVTVNFTSGGRWGTGTGVDNGNAKILNGFLDSGNTTVTFSGVPAGTHSVIVYVVNRPLAFSDADYALTDGNGNPVPSIYIRAQNSDEYNASPGFVRGTSTSASQRTVANYVRFDNVTSPAGGTITLTATAAAGSAPVNAVQLVINPPAVGTPPQITSQPASKNAVAGTSASFSVTATGTAPLKYEWRKGTTKLTDGGNVSGASTATLTVGNVQAADAGNYTVNVSNGSGGVNSSAAVLSVYDGTITDRLVGYWPFDEKTGLTAKNAVAGGSDGALKGYADSGTWSAGKIGGALSFDGASQFVIVPDYAKASTAVAVSAWVNASSANQDAMVIANAGANTQQGIRLSQFELGLSGTDGDTRGYIAAGPNPLTVREGSTAPLSIGDWHHLVLTADGGRLVIYRDGQRVGSTDYSGLITTATASCIGIGGIIDNTIDPTADPVDLACDHVLDTNPGLWTGLIDDVAVWTRTLGADEVTAIYNAGKAGKAVTTIPAIVTGPVVNPNPTIPGLSGGAFTDVQVDTANKTISAKLPAGGAQGFFSITPPVTIKTVTIVNGRLVITY
jgi:hypothetical protein